VGKGKRGTNANMTQKETSTFIPESIPPFSGPGLFVRLSVCLSDDDVMFFRNLRANFCSRLSLLENLDLLC
jgi:hypothetical protein